MTLTASDYRTSISAALERGMSAAQNKYDLSGWPADVVDTVTAVCELWYLRPPETKSAKAYWIKAARELIDACGEFGIRAIEEYRKDFEREMRRNKEKTGYGVAPHTVEGPGSLVKMVRAKTGELRQHEEAYQQIEPDERDEDEELLENLCIFMGDVRWWAHKLLTHAV